MFIRGYNHSLLKSPEQKPKWPKSFSNHPTSWKTTTLEAIHHIYIYTCTYKYIYIQSFQCLILTLKWKTWFLGYNAVLSLMVSSLNVSVPFVDWFYGCPRNKGWKQPEQNNWELEGIFGRSTTCLILRLKGAELYTRAVRPLRPVPTVTSQIAQLETIKKSSQARKHAGSSQLSNVNPGLINPKSV